MKKLFSIIASALLIVSCADRSKDVDTPFQTGQKVTLCASIATGDDASHAPQRVSGKDSDPSNPTSEINLTWDAGDKVLVKVGDNSSVFTLTSGAGTDKGSFYGEMPGDGSSYDVVYPADYSEDVLTEQTYVENGFGKGLMKMSTKTHGNLEDGFEMSADNALLGLQLTGNDEIGKIVLTNPADSKIYTLICTGVKLTSEAKIFYIVVPAGEWAIGFVVDVYASDDTKLKTLTKASNVTFIASQAMVMPKLDIDESVIEAVGFSISPDKQVTFSPGNLQYHPKNKEWRFAESQLDCIDEGNTNISADYDGWIDMFGWSGSDGSAKFGVSSSQNDNDYSGSFVDWGTNKIGTDAPNTWRTLTYFEWRHLLKTRPNASSLKGIACVNGVNGLVLLPDNWTCPAGVTFKSGFLTTERVHYSYHQSFGTEEWLKLESAGAVFLPAAGRRAGNYVSINYDGYYWSATAAFDALDDEIAAQAFSFTSREGNIVDHGYDFCSEGYSVRLVKDL